MYSFKYLRSTYVDDINSFLKVQFPSQMAFSVFSKEFIFPQKAIPEDIFPNMSNYTGKTWTMQGILFQVQINFCKNTMADMAMVDMSSVKLYDQTIQATATFSFKKKMCCQLDYERCFKNDIKNCKKNLRMTEPSSLVKKKLCSPAPLEDLNYNNYRSIFFVIIKIKITLALRKN